jgi:hypothetical protein
LDPAPPDWYIYNEGGKLVFRQADQDNSIELNPSSLKLDGLFSLVTSVENPTDPDTRKEILTIVNQGQGDLMTFTVSSTSATTTISSALLIEGDITASGNLIVDTGSTLTISPTPTTDPDSGQPYPAWSIYNDSSTLIFHNEMDTFNFLELSDPSSPDPQLRIAGAGIISGRLEVGTSSSTSTISLNGVAISSWSDIAGEEYYSKSQVDQMMADLRAEMAATYALK